MKNNETVWWERNVSDLAERNHHRSWLASFFVVVVVILVLLDFRSRVHWVKVLALLMVVF